jgi:hypothetical protein
MPRTPGSAGRVGTELDDRLAQILALQQSDKGCGRRVVDALDDVVAIFELTRA